MIARHPDVKKLIAILPIKKNSVRVPGKNFRDLDGMPLYCHILKTLSASARFDKIVIDTDCPEEFDSLIKTKTIEVQRRDPEVCGDNVSMNEVIKTVIDRNPADIYCQVHATSPFLTPFTLMQAMRVMDTLNESLDGYMYDCVYSVTEHRARFYTNYHVPLNHSERKLENTQNLIPLYSENSAFYIFRGDSFLDYGNSRICGKAYRVKVNSPENFDIDTEEEFALAECIIAGMKAICQQ